MNLQDLLRAMKPTPTKNGGFWCRADHPLLAELQDVIAELGAEPSDIVFVPNDPEQPIRLA
jgi:hypothetical protein